MPMKHCPICGEDYSDTYDTCPFCEEEKAMQEGKKPPRGNGRGNGRSHAFNLITPTLIVLIVIMAGLLIYLLYGDRFAEKGTPDEPVPPVEEVVPPVEDEENEPSEETDAPEETEDSEEEEEIVMPEDPAVTPKPEPKPEPTKPVDKTGYAKAAALPAGITLSSEDFTVSVAGESNVLRASGGKGTYQWYSEDPDVATVDANGKVTALSRGTVTIIATDGVKKGECIVRVNVSNTEPIAPSETVKPTNAKLNKEDYTTSVGEPDVKLTVSGTDSKVTWSTSDSSVASVSGGVVHAEGSGTATITAAVDGASLTCIVRVKG